MRSFGDYTILYYTILYYTILYCILYYTVYGVTGGRGRDHIIWIVGILPTSADHSSSGCEE